MTDQDIKDYLSTKQMIPKIWPTGQREYIECRFEDSESFRESVWRILYDIEERPVCEVCGGHVDFIGRKNIIFRKTCSKKCFGIRVSENTLELFEKMTPERKAEIQAKQQKTLIEKYGVDCMFKSDITKDAMIKKYGSASSLRIPEIREKIKRTNLERYGCENPMSNKEISSKAIKTRKERGYVSPWALGRNPSQIPESKAKIRATNQARYGGNSPMHDPKVKEKQRKARLENNGGVYTKYTPELHKKLSDKRNSSETIEKLKTTCLEKYGVDAWPKSNEFKKMMEDKKEQILDKSIKTKRQHHTFNTSIKETESLEIIQQKYHDVITQYKSVKYPFLCDFYIPSIDTYIECNYHWTHGGHPYDCNNEDDIKRVELWKSKDTKFYDNAITTWTERDVNKRTCAKNNGLNYIEIWNIDELKEWIESK